MASLFGSPRPPAPRAQSPAPLPSVAQTADTATEKTKDRLNQKRRGRSGTIATSFRGVLLPQETLSRRKRLLGE